MRSQRWQWTHTYGVHLLVASIVAVVLAGSGLIAATTLLEDTPNPPPPPPSTPSLSTTPRSGTEVDLACVVGTWQAVELEDVAWSGTWRLISGGPVVEYRDNGAGVIDYGAPEQDHSTTFEFTDVVFGGTSSSQPTGRREFQYAAEGTAIRHTYEDLLGGAQMHGLPYFPNEDLFAVDCQGDTMTLDGDKGYLELERR